MTLGKSIAAIFLFVAGFAGLGALFFYALSSTVLSDKRALSIIDVTNLANPPEAFLESTIEEYPRIIANRLRNIAEEAASAAGTDLPAGYQLGLRLINADMELEVSVIGPDAEDALKYTKLYTDTVLANAISLSEAQLQRGLDHNARLLRTAEESRDAFDAIREKLGKHILDQLESGGDAATSLDRDIRALNSISVTPTRLKEDVEEQERQTALIQLYRHPFLLQRPGNAPSLMSNRFFMLTFGALFGAALGFLLGFATVIGLRHDVRAEFAGDPI